MPADSARPAILRRRSASWDTTWFGRDGQLHSLAGIGPSRHRIVRLNMRKSVAPPTDEIAVSPAQALPL